MAAQDTISNIISGLVIMFDSPFRFGDRIEVTGLDTWGDAVNIGIRSTQIRTRDNRLIIVPNSAIVDSTVVNYSLPDSSYRLQSDIGIGSGMDIGIDLPNPSFTLDTKVTLSDEEVQWIAKVVIDR